MIQSAIDEKIGGNAALNNIELIHQNFTTKVGCVAHKYGPIKNCEIPDASLPQVIFPSLKDITLHQNKYKCRFEWSPLIGRFSSG